MSQTQSNSLIPTHLIPWFFLLGALSLWPAVMIGSYFTAVPIVAFLILIGLQITYRRAGETLHQLISSEGLLYANLGALAIVLLSSSLLLISFEATHIDNTLNGIGLLRMSLIVGAPIGVMTWVRISKKIQFKNIVMLKAFLISFALITATLASQFNRGTDAVEHHTLVANVLDKEKDDGGVMTLLTGGDAPHYIFVPFDESVERLVAPVGVWDTMFKSATINLSVREGRLGYSYIARFNDLAL